MYKQNNLPAGYANDLTFCEGMLLAIGQKKKVLHEQYLIHDVIVNKSFYKAN